MKCIVKKHKLFAGMLAAVLVLGGCGQTIEFEQPYGVYTSREVPGPGIEEVPKNLSFYASGLCVGGNENLLAEDVTESLSEAAGLFDLTNKEILYARNIHQRVAPASTTKLLTAYVAIKYGNLSDTTTVSATALDLEPGSSVAGLSEGEVLSLEQLLYGMLMCSGNDAANVIAEMISGSIEAFADLMNQEARALGATNSHFVNPHGLPAEEHYTSIYDLYLIGQAVMRLDPFPQIIGTSSYEASYTRQDGAGVTKEWKTTNLYLRGDAEIPEGITVIGGKTGTTDEAGYCLVLFSTGADGTSYLSVVMKAGTRSELYQHMTELLKKTL